MEDKNFMVIHKSAKVFTLEIIRLYGNTSATFVRVVLWFIVAYITCTGFINCWAISVVSYKLG